MDDKHPASDTTENISPFVFHKINLAHLEIDKEIVLKFRKATFVDHEYYKEKHKDDSFVEHFKTPANFARELFRFLSKESKKELMAIKFTEFDDKTGKEKPVSYSLDKVFLMILVSSVEEQNQLTKTYFKIFGYDSKDIKVIMGEKDPEPQKKQKKTPKPIPKKRR